MPKTTTPLPQLISDRAHRALSRIRQLIWQDQTLLEVKIGPLNKAFIPLRQAKRQKMQPIKPGTYFAPQSWQQRWFSLHIPKARSNESGRRYLRWQSHGETTVYIDGKPWAGLDIAHPRCPLPDKACHLWMDTGTYQTGIWPTPAPPPIDGNGCRFDYALLDIRNESAWEAYHDLDSLLQLVRYYLRKMDRAQRGAQYHPPIDDCPPFLRRMLKMLDDAVDLFDADGLKSFLPALKKIYRDFPAESWGVKTGLMGHAHMDLVWLWPENVTYRKTIHTYATMLRLMDKYPDVVFSMSQPALLDKIKKYAPQQYAEIRSRIQEGRWEATGGFYVEADTQIPSGEGLARTLAYGQERIKRFKGSYATTGWLPDVFGYNQYLPQILSLSGISNFFTAKMTWSAVSRFPHHSFVWKSPDGSELLTHLAPVGYNGQVSVNEIITGMEAYRQADAHNDRLAPTGYGDGAGGLTEEHCERAIRLHNLATVPKTSWTTAEAFFRRLESVRDELPVYQGELYLEFHRGTYTTQSRLKCNYRKAETSLRAAEAASVVTSKGPVDLNLWHRVIFTQFHDSLPGSSIKIVYDELVPELELIGKTALKAAEDRLKGASKKRGLTVFNPLAMPLSTVIDLPVSIAGKSMPAVWDQLGNRLPIQVVENGKNRKAIISLQLDALESRYLEIKKQTESSVSKNAAVMVASEKRLSNGIVDARFDSNGQLGALSIADESLQMSDKAGFMLHEDNPASFDAWDIDHHATWLLKKACSKVKLKVIENGPVRARLKGESSLGEKSGMSVTYSVEKDIPLLKVAVEVDWHEANKMLRYRIPTEFKGVMARYGCPFGHIDRNQKAGGQSDEAQWEVPGSRWMAGLNALGHGISIVTEAKYGFSCREGQAGITLLRSPKNPDPAADMGKHKIRFAIGQYRPLTKGSRLSTAAEAEAAYASPVVIKGDNRKPSPFQLMNLKGMVPAWVLPAEKSKGYILRANESTGISGHFEIAFARAPRKVRLVDFLERPMQGKIVKRDARRYRVSYRAHQILSIKIQP